METLRYFIVVALFLFFQATLTAQNVSPQFSELKGMEDAQGNTHLLYRIHSSQSNGPNISGSNDIYNFKLESFEDVLFLEDSFWCNLIGGGGITVSSYDIWNSDVNKYIYTGELVNCFEPYFYISRFDTNLVYGDGFTYITKMYISKQNDSLVFALPYLKSTDGGFNWDTLQLAHQLASVSSIDDKVYFSRDNTTSNTSALFKSTNSGLNFTLVDTGSYYYGNFYYDTDGIHLYSTLSYGDPNYVLKMSPNQGNAFSWQSIYSTDYNFSIALNESQSGVIYLADVKRIFRSADYGNTFTLYKELDKRIIGIYKKPNSNKLYAATNYRIYEITDDTITVIKSLPIPDELLSFYPLKVGNKWVYDYYYVDGGMWDFVDIYYREVLSEKVKANNKKYFEILEKYVNQGIIDTVYERIDSLEGKVYRFQPDCPDSEQLIEDLVIEVNDSSFASRFEYCIEHPPTELVSELNYSKWGFNIKDRKYRSVSLLISDYNLFSDIGLGYIELSDDLGDKIFFIKGMIKNGIVYGDTTLTDVANEIELPKEFSLSQNFPNPFNPSTKISWQSPVGSWQTLKIYDVLGNEVATLVDEYRNAGRFDVNFNASQLSSGIYFYQLKAGDFVETKKMILIK